MTLPAVERAAVQAGFQRLPGGGPIRILFTRGANFLNVHTDGKWAYYSEIVDGRTPDRSGSDFESLLNFLTTRENK
jgi:hypothetical protein